MLVASARAHTLSTQLVCVSQKSETKPVPNEERTRIVLRPAVTFCYSIQLVPWLRGAGAGSWYARTELKWNGIVHSRSTHKSVQNIERGAQNRLFDP